MRAALPAPLSEGARLVVAQRLERRRRRSGAVRGAALVFHAVADHAGDRDYEIDPPISRSRLERAIAYLTRRYRLVRASELPAEARARQPGEPVPIAVTFDDDLSSHADLAAPALMRHGAVATAFLCGVRRPFWWQLLQAGVDTRAITPDRLAPVAPALVSEALERRPEAIRRLAKAIEDLAPDDRDRVDGVLRAAAPPPAGVIDAHGVASLLAAGWELGFHTERHDVLTALDEPALRAALRRSPVGRTGTLPGALAYPHGKAAGREARAAREAGYVAAFTGRHEVFTDRTDIHLIGRLQPDTSTTGRFALQIARALSA